MEKPVLLWIWGLMAIFFFLVGLKIKRDLVVGELSSRLARHCRHGRHGNAGAHHRQGRITREGAALGCSLARGMAAATTTPRQCGVYSRLQDAHPDRQPNAQLGRQPRVGARRNAALSPCPSVSSPALSLANCWAGRRQLACPASGLAQKPAGATWQQPVGVGMLGGIGFTTSLFIGTLALRDPADNCATARLGVLTHP